MKCHGARFEAGHGPVAQQSTGMQVLLDRILRWQQSKYYLKSLETLNNLVGPGLAPACLNCLHALRGYLEALVLRCSDIISQHSQRSLSWAWH